MVVGSTRGSSHTLSVTSNPSRRRSPDRINQLTSAEIDGVRHESAVGNAAPDHISSDAHLARVSIFVVFCIKLLA